MFRKTLAIIMVAVAVGLTGVLGLGLVSAQQVSATRSFSPTTVAPGGQVVVTINAANYGGFGRVTETLPSGFDYVSSPHDDGSGSVDVNGQIVRFTLQGDSSFMYTVTASSVEGSHTFSGMLRDSDRENHNVGGVRTVTVAAPTQQGPRATRSFSPTTVAPGGQVVVTITAADYGNFGRVTETLPPDFDYVTSSLDDAEVSVTGQTVRFTLQGANVGFTYTVTAPDTVTATMVHEFDGMLRDSDRGDSDVNNVGGVTGVTVEAPAQQGPRATRSFSPTTVAPGGQVVVTITAADYGNFGRVTETLPPDFDYVTSSLDDAEVSVTGQTVRFTLQGANVGFTYTVTAPDTENTYTFMGGVLRDDDRMDHVMRDTAIRVETEQTPSPSGNTAPRFRTGTAFSVAENTTAVATVLATDRDSQDSVTGYKITGGADQDEFSLVSNTGDLSFTTAPDFDHPTDADTNNEYVLMVTATSGAGDRQRTATQTIAVTVTEEGAPVEPGADTCIADLGALTASQTVMGAWASDCESVARTGSYAEYYTFTLDSPTQVEINLTSGVDAYLALRQGAGRDGTMVASNDNVGSRNPNSAINMMLAAGTYTVEATTFFAGQTGDFTLSVRPLQETEDLETLTGSVDRSNSMWTSDHMSTQQAGSYARSYTFTVNTATHVAINLTSPEDSYLYVLDANGAVVHENDNVTDRNLNSRIDETLAAGMYTIEATTYHPARMGVFHLSIGVLP